MATFKICLCFSQVNGEVHPQNGVSVQLLSPNNQPQAPVSGVSPQTRRKSSEPKHHRRQSRANAEARRQNRRKTFQNQKHRITVSLFLVCLCFIIIIIPQTAIQLINYFTENLSMTLVLNIYSITELIYLLNFVINPVIFAYNNSYLTEQIKKRVPKRFKKNEKNGLEGKKTQNGASAIPMNSTALKKTTIPTMPTSLVTIGNNAPLTSEL